EAVIKAVEDRLNGSSLLKGFLGFGANSLNAIAGGIAPDTPAAALRRTEGALANLRTPQGRAGFAGGEEAYRARIKELEAEAKLLAEIERRRRQAIQLPELRKAAEAEERRHSEARAFGETLDETT